MVDDKRRYTIISSDAHAGAELRAYKPYLEKQFHDEFETWAADFKDAWSDQDLEMIDTDDPNLRVGTASFCSEYNWDSDKRLEHQNNQGIAAEVIFPNTVPPFYPSGAVTASAPSTDEEYRLRSAGVKAHNRWMVDFCAEAPGRRGGLAQVFLRDVDDAIEEVRWAKESGLAGILIPADHISQLIELYDQRLDPFWSVCSELQMPVHRHALSVSPPETPDTPAAPAIGVHECFLFFQRGLSHLIFGGVFERHPDLTFVFTETSFYWILAQLQQMEIELRQGVTRGATGYPHFRRIADSLSLSPTEYFNRNCHVGASLMLSMDIGMRHQIGIERIMWGADYPHHEGTFPNNKLAMRLNFSGVPEQEVRTMTSLNAAKVYGFDLENLQKVADQIGPTVEEMATPVSPDELPVHSMCMTISEAIPVGAA